MHEKHETVGNGPTDNIQGRKLKNTNKNISGTLYVFSYKLLFKGALIHFHKPQLLKKEIINVEKPEIH